MYIQSFTLRNYRSFVDLTTIELRPLTLLFGYNNTGKSVLLRTLPLIADSLKGQSTTPLALQSSAVRESHFNELLSRISGRNEFELELSLDNAQCHCLKWTLREIPEFKTHVISHFSILYSDGVDVKAQWTAKRMSTQKKLSNEYDIQIAQELFSEIELEFKGLLALPVTKNDQITPTQETKLRRLWMPFPLETRLQWLSSIRRLPLRYNPFQGSVPNNLAPDGQGIVDILAYDSITEKSILPKVSYWYEKHLKQRLLVQMGDFSRGDLCSLMFEQQKNSPYQVNIVDVGEGALQVLPVLVASAMASEGKTDILAIEEPESNLHPRLHAALAENFCELAKQKNPPKEYNYKDCL